MHLFPISDLNKNKLPVAVAKIWTDARRPVPRPGTRSAEIRRERRYENGNTTTTLATPGFVRDGYILSVVLV